MLSEERLSDGYRRVLADEAGELLEQHKPGGRHGEGCQWRGPCGPEIVAAGTGALLSEITALGVELAAAVAERDTMRDLAGEMTEKFRREGQERSRVLIELDAAQAEAGRLRETVRGAWRFWAAMTSGDPPTSDRGFTMVRVTPDQYAAFDALFRPGAQPQPAAASSDDRPGGEL